MTGMWDAVAWQPSDVMLFANRCDQTVSTQDSPSDGENTLSPLKGVSASMHEYNK